MPTKAPPKKSTSKTSQKVRTTGPRVIDWIEAHCVFTAGRWRGQPVELLPWQKRLILELFEVEKHGKRRYKWALWGVPKKNGKTELAAMLALYFLLADGEPSPLVVCAASTKEQANLVFGAAKTMCELSPTLSRFTETFRDQIEAKTPLGGVLKKVAAVDGANDGMNISAVICDELHEWSGERGENVWNVLTNGTGAREQPMVLQITTAGFDRESLCYREYERGRKIESGESDRRNYHFFWASAPDDADPSDPQTWALANPSYGVTVQPEFFHDQFETKPLFIFQRYFTNVWTTADSAWLPAGAWADCFDPQDTVIPEHAAVWAIVDIGFKSDASAVVVLWTRPDGRVVPEAHIFEPPENGKLDLAAVDNCIRDMAVRYHVNGVLYDKWAFEHQAQQLSAEGLLMVEFPLTNERMCPASQALYDAIVQKKFAHNGDPKLAAHVAAGATKDTERGWRLTKVSRGAGRIDALICMCIGYTKAGEAQTSGGFEW